MTLKHYYTEAGAKPKMLYFQYWEDNKVMRCSLDIVKEPERLSILITSPEFVEGSITNNIEIIAYTLYVRLRLENLVSDSSEIVWYELYLDRDFTIDKVELEWDGVEFKNPSWNEVDPQQVPLDFSDYLELYRSI